MHITLLVRSCLPELLVARKQGLRYIFRFFQAEDGRRLAHESRGLGDVSKRQVLIMAPLDSRVQMELIISILE